MPTTLTATNHIRVDDQGIAFIEGTRYKVIQIALDKIAYGWSPEEIVIQHYHDLTLAQVHAALAFYYDNQAIFDAEIEKRKHEYEELRAKSLDSPGRRKLKEKGLLS